MELRDKTAIVTGGGSGLGRGISLLFAKEGADVIVADFSIGGGKETVAAIEAAGGRACFVQGDVTNPQYHFDLVAAAKSRYGKLDIAVNNAGISSPPTPLAEISLESWDRIIAVNLSGVFYAVRAQIPAMIEWGAGVIVNMASVAGAKPNPGVAHYTASKHGVVGLTKSIAVEYAKRGIRANSVGPGYIKTPLSNHFPPEERAKLAAVHPVGRMGEVDEVAQLVLWLASPKASFVTGAFVPVDGGTLAA